MKKLRNCRGETLVESLAAILIIAVVFVFLSSAIVSAARSNEQLRRSDQDFHYSEMVSKGIVTMQVVDAGIPSGGEGMTSVFASAYPVEKFETASSESVKSDDYEKTIYRYFAPISQEETK